MTRTQEATARLQEIFDKAVGGVIRQGGPSADSDGFCLYRADDGRKCAVGHLIPDEKYSPDFEQRQLSDANTSDIAEAAGLQDLTALFLAKRLQDVHDDSARTKTGRVSDKKFIAKFERDCRVIASQEGLEYQIDAALASAQGGE